MTRAVRVAPARRTPLAVGGALLAAVLAAGCGDAQTDRDATPADGGGKATVKTGSPQESSTPQGSRTPEASEPPPLVASDGTRYAACQDGTCEVAVAEPAEIALPGGSFTVEQVKPGRSVQFEMETRFGGGNGTLKGTCGTELSFYPGGGGMVSKACEPGSTPSPPAAEPGTLKLQLVGWDDDGAAVMRFVSAG